MYFSTNNRSFILSFTISISIILATYYITVYHIINYCVKKGSGNMVKDFSSIERGYNVGFSAQ